MRTQDRLTTEERAWLTKEMGRVDTKLKSLNAERIEVEKRKSALKAIYYEHARRSAVEHSKKLCDKVVNANDRQPSRPGGDVTLSTASSSSRESPRLVEGKREKIVDNQDKLQRGQKTELGIVQRQIIKTNEQQQPEVRCKEKPQVRTVAEWVKDRIGKLESPRREDPVMIDGFLKENNSELKVTDDFYDEQHISPEGYWLGAPWGPRNSFASSESVPSRASSASLAGYCSTVPRSENSIVTRTSSKSLTTDEERTQSLSRGKSNSSSE